MAKKYLLLAVLCLYSSTIVSMEKGKQSKSIDTNLVKLDAIIMYAGITGYFKSAAKMNHPKHTPSVILKMFAMVADQNKFFKIPLEYMTAGQYVSTIIDPHYATLDKAFKDKLQALNDRQKTWEWFIDNYFEKHGICEPFSKHYGIEITECSTAAIPGLFK